MMSELRFSPSALRGYVASPGWPRHLVGLAALAAAILLLFAQDALDMVRIWWTSSTYAGCSAMRRGWRCCAMVASW